MRNKETVFWLTLIDFLTQLIFFGLFFGATYLAAQAVLERKEQQKVAEAQASRTLHKARKRTQEVAQGSGVSDIVNLTDEMTRLVPADRLPRFVEELRRSGPEKMINATDQLQQLRKGLGPPPCIPGPNGVGYRPTARIRASDEKIEFVAETPELDAVLTELGLQFGQISSLPPDEFLKRFGSLRSLHKDCVYYIDVDDRFTLAITQKAIEAGFNFGARR